MLSVGVLISGRGSNLQALIQAASVEGYPAQIACVIADCEAAGLDHARKAGIPAFVIGRKAYETKAAFEKAITAKFEEHGVRLICLAGFMRILSAEFVTEWLDRLINIHPSLLPSFPGLDVQQRAIDGGVKFSGCTVHFVRAEMDAGPIIIQAVVPVLQDDDSHALADRILVQEHKIYPYAVRLIAEGRVNVHDGKTFIADVSAPEAVINPAL